MPIYRLLENSAFGPERITAMTAAFEAVCDELGLTKRDDPLRDTVAKAIIDCAKRGDFDPVQLRECAREALKH
jgi:hypothetical protein